MEILRDPLWNNIRLDPLALALLETPVVQRLRYVRQLGLAFLVYPGATHSRFEHALGAWHLAGVALRLLEERGALHGIDARAQQIVRAAALLHDVGHYPFSHALEEIGVTHHEQVAYPLITSGPVATVLRDALGESAPEEVFALITGRSTDALQGLISGSLDLDKIEYLKRDATMCGVPYGEIDVDRLLNSLVIVQTPERTTRMVGVHEKGLSALESLLFAKYQMYRNVYWHHAVRSATAMYKRLVAVALDSGHVASDTVARFTDEGLLVHLDVPSLPTEARVMLDGLRFRRLHKRAYECPAATLGEDVGEWIASDFHLARRVEDAFARELGLPAGAVLLDYPAKTQMLGLDIPMQRRDGRVEQLTAAGWEGAINLPRLSDELYRSARRLRVFTTDRAPVPEARVLRALREDADVVRTRLDAGTALLG
ncbi:HD domain-containing protein [Gemmatimonas groenlandica]|uniref:HD domain-containing protein n=1 Tax=Gemmatimonas groenlandica TaxID=2732249 RepID=A0A6M4IIZ6_9BACT|nr:HD domain-containing protein [Gemmatimonas groenlandica]QJR34600.1 HD domain-containing protein [Gemmatimonas groenlandica]